jgi:glycosyltransferase involved in cell wall biosynthesis
MFPEAPIYTSQYDPNTVLGFENADVRTTRLQKLPFTFRKFLPLLRAWEFGRLDLSEYDLVISSSGAEAKGVKTGRNTLHICYLHAPTHYYWIRHEEYLSNPGFPRGLNWLAKLSLKLLVGPLKRWDRRAARQPDFIVTNSTHTRDMIKRFYRREAEVIHPPVDVDRFKQRGKPDLRHGFVIAGRQAPYKRVDLAIEACDQLKVPLVVIGDGPEHRRLEKLANRLPGRGTTFLTAVSDNDIVEHFQTAVGFIMPNMDDFGIVAVEAMAAGTPVIAYKKGGSLDYVVPDKTGLFFERQTVKDLAGTLEAALAKNFNHEAIANHAQQFSTEHFVKNMREYIDARLAERS